MACFDSIVSVDVRSIDQTEPNKCEQLSELEHRAWESKKPRAQPK